MLLSRCLGQNAALLDQAIANKDSAEVQFNAHSLKGASATIGAVQLSEAARKLEIEPIEMNESVFRELHAKDRMANEKLDEGIHGFTKAIVAAENLLRERYEALQGRGHCGDLARHFFHAFDLTGDGYIDLEEWCGTRAVFDALDTNGDGRISMEELGAGIGCGFPDESSG